MSLKYPDSLVHSNSDLSLVDSDFIKGGNRTVNSTSDLQNIPVDQLKRYVTRVYVTGSTNWYTLVGSDHTVVGSGGWVADSNSYELPNADANTLGGVSIPTNSGLSVTDGSLSINANNGITKGTSGLYLGGTLNKNTYIVGSSYCLAVGAVDTGASYDAHLYIGAETSKNTALTTRKDILINNDSANIAGHFNSLNIKNTSSNVFGTNTNYSSSINLLTFNTNYASNGLLTTVTNPSTLVSSSIHSVRIAAPSSIYNLNSSRVSGVTSLLSLTGTTSEQTVNTGTPIAGSAIAWSTSTQYYADNTTSSYAQYVTHSGNVYKCVTGGVSASSGGPTGTDPDTDITDGSAVWRYISSATDAPDYNYQLGNISLMRSGVVSSTAAISSPYFNGVINTLSGLYIDNIPKTFSALNSGNVTGIINNVYGIYIDGDNSDYSTNVKGRYGIYQAGISDVNVFNGPTTFVSGGFDSDIRLKTDIIYDPFVQDIGTIKAVSYRMNDDFHIGYIAQDIQQVIPSAIISKPDGYLAVAYHEVHTAKIQYLENQIKRLTKILEQNELI